MTVIWRPTLLESRDGYPLATEISHLYWAFPYHRLPESPVLQIFLRPECVLALVAFYLASKPMFKEVAKTIDPKSSWFIHSIALHNASLAIFSAVVAWNSWPIIGQHYQRYGAFDTYCDPNGTLWRRPSDFGAWALIFYISKYYEFADTWILVLKGKPPSFLQVYHHTGIAICMWIGVLSQSSWLKAVVLLNSVIHTLMYTYFFVKTVRPKTEIKSARYLTQMQIGQFFTGIIYSAAVLFLGDTCDTPSSRFGLACLQLYGYGLIALFMAFAKRKYKKKT
ncbi:GNS1/SUR4 family protein [Nitzschia inconspicua]|uniref:Elongation of fatty acids protein n=1 Tax=Nitzschia inconspicua TaxID=303405 RepID=A0A9K3Q6P9_9STRA|nr:GNS1/SUR4 family protein [Nitzschia inconspicua]